MILGRKAISVHLKKIWRWLLIKIHLEHWSGHQRIAFSCRFHLVCNLRQFIDQGWFYVEKLVQKLQKWGHSWKRSWRNFFHAKPATLIFTPLQRGESATSSEMHHFSYGAQRWDCSTFEELEPAEIHKILNFENFRTGQFLFEWAWKDIHLCQFS